MTPDYRSPGGPTGNRSAKPAFYFRYEGRNAQRATYALSPPQ
jgi:hypothetical protein